MGKKYADDLDMRFIISTFATSTRGSLSTKRKPPKHQISGEEIIEERNSI